MSKMYDETPLQEKQKIIDKQDIILISILIFAVIMVIFYNYYYNDNMEYHFYEANCKLKSINDTCDDTIEVDIISMGGINYTKYEVNEELLDKRCYKLNYNTWGCTKWLVIYE